MPKKQPSHETLRATGGSAVVLLSCPDQKGLVAAVSNFLFKNGGNIIDADQHTDLETGAFFLRLAWQLEDFELSREEIAPAFEKLARKFRMRWKLYFSEDSVRVAVFVSKGTHCLHDLLSRREEGDLACEIPLVVSNHLEAEDIAHRFRVRFKYFPDPLKSENESKIFKLLSEHKISTIVLARYMQILGPGYLKSFPNEIINIHHSFLPAFKGGSPYDQAFQRGVKIIGATSHYVTAKLDEGPIIEQDVIRVSHRDSLEDLRRKGKDLERVVLARALRLHLDRRVLVYKNKTLIFE
jgi:formyltetrahydrofolate deformylase